MQHFPIFVATKDQRIVVSGGGEAATAKLRLLLKTSAHVDVYALDPCGDIRDWAEAGRISLHTRAITPADVQGALLFYAADEDQELDHATTKMARAAGVLSNIVDNLEDSQFITPAIVDRDPVTIAIGTEGAAPVLARLIKAHLEEVLSPALGALTRVAKGFRQAASILPMGRARRDFWHAFYTADGPKAYETQGEAGVQETLSTLLAEHAAGTTKKGSVDFVGAGPGDPELLTLKARKALDQADVVIHDRLVSQDILEIARREAILVNVGKKGFGTAVAQDKINELIVAHASQGHRVVRLKGGDPTMFGRLDEEIEACDSAGFGWRIVPGITASSAGAAAIGQSLTKRLRNSGVRQLTGHDTQGFADHEWRALAKSGEVAAIYMGKRSARFVQGRLLMHGADPATPVTIIESASCHDQRIIETQLADYPTVVAASGIEGPALTLIGIAPRTSNETNQAKPQIQELA